MKLIEARLRNVSLEEISHQTRLHAFDLARLNGALDLPEERMLGINGYTKKDLIDVVPHARSVPQIFLDGVYVGGLQELKRKLANDNNKNTNMV